MFQNIRQNATNAADDVKIVILETSGAHSRSEKKVTALVSGALFVSLSVFAISPFYW